MYSIFLGGLCQMIILGAAVGSACRLRGWCWWFLIVLSDCCAQKLEQLTAVGGVARNHERHFDIEDGVLEQFRVGVSAQFSVDRLQVVEKVVGSPADQHFECVTVAVAANDLYLVFCFVELLQNAAVAKSVNDRQALVVDFGNRFRVDGIGSSPEEEPNREVVWQRYRPDVLLKVRHPLRSKVNVGLARLKLKVDSWGGV